MFILSNKFCETNLWRDAGSVYSFNPNYFSRYYLKFIIY